MNEQPGRWWRRIPLVARLVRFLRRRRRLRDVVSKRPPFVPHRDENLESYAHLRDRQYFNQV